MAYKQSKHLFTGMNRDLSDDKTKRETYIDAHNVRITAREDTTLLSVTNEKGNINITGNFTLEEGSNYNIALSTNGYVGHAVIEGYLVIFVHTNNNDIIYRVNIDQTSYKVLYVGHLNFSLEHPLETLVDYETDAIQKVYWVDGVNQPRLINIMSDNIIPGLDSQFDFIPEVIYPNNLLDVDIAKLEGTDGLFAAGTIQYFITYYKINGQQTNIVYQSPLYYTSPSDRGGSTTETVSNSFKIELNNIDSNFDFVRIYSLQHTSLNTDLIGRKVIDLPTTSTNITFIDNGTQGESIEPSDILFIGGVPTIVETMAAKDQVLFLGNLITNTNAVAQSVKDTLKNSNISWSREARSTKTDDAQGKIYDYTNQLVNSSNDIKSFKYLETYRLGLQFQDKFGVWSEPVWIGDSKNNISPRLNLVTKRIEYPKATISIPSSVLNTLASDLQKYGKVRPVIVLPAENERECVAQGVLCPTVYNVQDRMDNSPFAQPSWFFRCDSDVDLPAVTHRTSNGYDSYLNTITATNDKGQPIPFKHNSKILGGDSLYGEIERANKYQVPPVALNTNNPEASSENFIKEHKNDYYVDQSIVTLNSPDIEFNTNIYQNDLQNCGFRIVGAIDITGFAGKLYYNTEAAPNYYMYLRGNHPDSAGVSWELSTEVSGGDLGNHINAPNYSLDRGWHTMIGGPYWKDAPYMGSYGNTDIWANYSHAYMIYTWQKTGFISPHKEDFSIKEKVISNIKYSSFTSYLNADDINFNKYDTSDIKVVNPDILDTVKLKAPTDLGYSEDTIVYYGKIDKLLEAELNGLTVSNYLESPEGKTYPTSSTYHHLSEDEDVLATYISAPGYTPAYYTTLDNKMKQTTAYHTFDTKELVYADYDLYIGMLPHIFMWLGSGATEVYGEYGSRVKKTTTTSIKYTSSSHAVVVLNTKKLGSFPNIQNAQTILPSINWRNQLDVDCGVDPNGTSSGGIMLNYYKPLTHWNNHFHSPAKYFWSNKINGVYQNNINITFDSNVSNITDVGTLLIGEIYRTNITDATRFGGQTDEALQNNRWIPAGKEISIENRDTNNNLVIDWLEGDTYFQRYDCLKTYPIAGTNENNVVDILSFMCESRVNIAGRYDKNRGLTDNTLITNENFNLLNPVYSQHNNFFTYNILDSRFTKTNKFKNQLTWTKVKSANALIDNWTNLVLANTLDLDGDKGEIISLNKYNNNIISFQPKGIAQILFNSNVQISTENSIPIELANSGKVEGKRYIYEGIGCQNKWSILDNCSSGLYFIDNISNNIYNIGSEGILSISSKNGFNEFMVNNTTLKKWNPSTMLNFRTFYDSNFGDIYFVKDDVCLVYSEKLGVFTSFMDYNSTQAMMNINNQFYAIYDVVGEHGGLYHQFNGTYNNIYGIDRPYWITFMENENPEINKIFCTLDFRSDTYLDDTLQDFETFDTIRVFNEYQDTTEVPLARLIATPSNLQKKFRVWRIQIPRDSSNGMTRINNTWTKITLKKLSPTREKTELHDTVVGYYF